MGGLIQTKGTKLLAAHFRQEFSTWIDFYRQPGHIAYFDTTAVGWNPLGTGGLLYATNSIYATAPHSLRTEIVGPPPRGKEPAAIFSRRNSAPSLGEAVVMVFEHLGNTRSARFTDPAK